MARSLDTPADPLPTWTLYRGLLQGAHKFVSREVRSWDNEGVLTGGLLAKFLTKSKIGVLKVLEATGRTPVFISVGLTPF